MVHGCAVTRGRRAGHPSFHPRNWTRGRRGAVARVGGAAEAGARRRSTRSGRLRVQAAVERRVAVSDERVGRRTHTAATSRRSTARSAALAAPLVSGRLRDRPLSSGSARPRPRSGGSASSRGSARRWHGRGLSRRGPDWCRRVALKGPDLTGGPTRRSQPALRAGSPAGLRHQPSEHRADLRDRRADGVAFIAMEFVDGEALSARAGAGRWLADVVEIAIQTFDALDEAHARGSSTAISSRLTS